MGWRTRTAIAALLMRQRWRTTLSKCAKYNTPTVRDWCQANLPSSIPSGAVRFGDVPAICMHVSRDVSHQRVQDIYSMQCSRVGWRVFIQNTARWR